MFAKERKKVVWTEILKWFGHEETHAMDRTLPGRMSPLLPQTTDCCNQKVSAQRLLSFWRTQGQILLPTYHSWRQTGR